MTESRRNFEHPMSQDINKFMSDKTTKMQH